MLGPVPRNPRAAATLAAAGLVAILVVAAGDDAFWLAVPVAVLAAAVGGSRRAAILQVVAIAAICAIPAWAGGGPGPSPPVAIATLALSAGITLLMRERLEAQGAALRRLSRVDDLTGLGNRRLLDERLAYEVARHARHGREFSVIVLDLDGFKLVNDRYGHAAGDEVLSDVGAALARAVRGQDTVVRYGGDEFCVLAPESGAADAEQLAGRLAAAVGEATYGLEMLGTSLGRATFPEDAHDPAALVACADARQADDKRTRRAARERRASAAARHAA